MKLSYSAPLAVHTPQEIFLLTFLQQTFLGWFSASKDQAQSSIFLLHKPQMWAAVLALPLSFPSQDWLLFTWQLTRVSGDLPEQCFPRFQPCCTLQAQHSSLEESSSGGNVCQTTTMHEAPVPKPAWPSQSSKGDSSVPLTMQWSQCLPCSWKHKFLQKTYDFF